MGSLSNLSLRIRPHTAFLAIIALSAMMYFAFLGDTRQFLRAESYFSLGSKMMLETGDQLLMHSQEELPLNKPPLQYWIIGLSFTAFGTDYGPARAPSGVFALLTLGLVYLFASRSYGRTVGITATAMTATSVFFIAFARLAMPDMLLTFCVCSGLFALSLADREDGGGKVWAWLAYAAMAVGFLAKGPITIVLVLAPFFAEAAWSRDIGLLKRLRPITGAIVFLAIAAPYFVLVYLRDGIEPLRNWFINENLKRFSGELYATPRPMWQYPFDSFVTGFFPWSFLIPSVWYYDIRRRETGCESRTLCVLNFAIVLSIAFFAVSKFRLDYYILPVIPFAAIVTARLVSEREISAQFARKVLPIFAGVIAIPIGLIAAVLLSGRLVESLPDVPNLWVAGAIVLAGLLPAAMLLKRHRRTYLPLAIAASICVGTCVTFFIANRQIVHLQPVAELAAQIPENSEVYALPSADGWAQDLMFELPSRKRVIFLPRDGTGPTVLRKVLLGPKPVTALVYRKDIEKMDLPEGQTTIIEGGTVYRGRSISFKTLEDPNFDELELITNQIPPR